ncbi:uncharacterized protein [Musca autumnalis]|uniref:uncharacterized protein n=1 Tax=Musca autumnalis TaxID=221902 RepID=UPI003CEBBB19
MANYKTDFQINNENQNTFLASKNAMDNVRKHTIKKQAFGELKNVIHNQLQPKSLKFDEVRLNKPQKCTELRPIIQKHQQPIKVAAKPINKTKTAKQCHEADLELLNYFDFAPSCCAEPYKGDRQIWYENIFDDSMIDSLIKGAYDATEDEEEGTHDENLELKDFVSDDSGCEDLLDFDTSKCFNFLDKDLNFEQMIPPPSLMDLPPSVIGELPDFEDF